MKRAEDIALYCLNKAHDSNCDLALMQAKERHLRGGYLDANREKRGMLLARVETLLEVARYANSFGDAK